MNRREFIRRGVYLAGAFACLPSGVAVADLDAAEGVSIAGNAQLTASVTITPPPPGMAVGDWWKRKGEILKVERIDDDCAHLVPLHPGEVWEGGLWLEVQPEMGPVT